MDAAGLIQDFHSPFRVATAGASTMSIARGNDGAGSKYSGRLNRPPVRLTGPVNHGVLFKVICFAQNPSAALRGGFLRWGAADNMTPVILRYAIAHRRMTSAAGSVPLGRLLPPAILFINCQGDFSCNRQFCALVLPHRDC